ncbi:short-chain dehydrogenase [Acuticoccus sediminis]|uniref:Short-chain dehydrogenase n=1 Tax=Acuticoccus sediminis TaxID=2184697 RepID=A0A8B2P0T4_9HYPH|nr:SDR family NAD(P)-dependent oxidoreductase [Acuticoccus sediminis]RAI01877.1 short-chain dehydrogenase [Acuticoccus sediminis]
MDLKTTTALVTGANRGLGLAIADALELGGAKVYVASRSGRTDARERFIPVTLDVTDPASIAAAADRLGDVTLLVNNAGILAGGGPISAPGLDGARAEMETNYFGSLAMARAFAPLIAANGGGAIVNVASILSHAPIPQAGTYSASKAAVLSMTQAMRAELAPRGVRVLAVLPAYIETDMTAGLTANKISPAAVADALVAGLRGDAEDIYPGEAAEFVRNFYADPKGYERTLANGAGAEPARTAAQ